jgi:hypothetical protein
MPFPPNVALRPAKKGKRDDGEALLCVRFLPVQLIASRENRAIIFEQIPALAFRLVEDPTVVDVVGVHPFFAKRRVSGCSTVFQIEKYLHERREQDRGYGPQDERRRRRRETREADAVLVWLVERETVFDGITSLAACCGPRFTIQQR